MSEILSDVLEKCRNGDAQAVQVLVRRFQRWAFDLARALVHDPVLAEDVVQEAFVQALQGLDALRNPDAFPGWLRQIIRRQANRLARKFGDGVAADTQRSWEPRARSDQRLEREELRAILRDAFDKLPPAEQDAAVRFYLEQQSCLEIARLLAIPPATVRRRLFDARKRMRNMLLGYIHDETRPPDASSNARDLPF